MQLSYLKNTPTLKLISENCTGCGFCLAVCPRNVLREDADKIAITALDRCMECGACMTNCSFNAIHVDAGTGCAIAIINGLFRKKEPHC